MKLLGKVGKGGMSFALGADTKRVARYTVASKVNAVKLSIYVDGLGSGVGDQVMRGVIYDTAGNLVAVGDEVVVRDGQAAGWVDLPLSAYRGGVPLVAASYDFGVLGGAQTNSIRVFGDDPGSGSLTGTLPLTVSGNEITDATRLATPAVGQMLDGRGVTFLVNQVPNGGAEINLTGWIVENTVTLARVTGQQKFGSASGQATMTGANGQVGIRDLAGNRLPVVAGQTYSYSWWGKMRANYGTRQFTIRALHYDAGGANLNSQFGANVLASTSYQQVTASFTAPAGAASVRFILYLDQSSAGAAGEIYDVDGVQLELGAVVHPYIDTQAGPAGVMQGTGDSSYGIHRPATNLFRDGQCAAVTAGATWGLAGTGVTIAPDPGMPAPFSTQSCRVVCDGTVAQQGIQPTTASGQAAAVGVSGVGSTWFRGVAGASYLCWVRWYDATPANLGDGAQTTFTATGGWQLLTPASLAVPSGTGDKFGLMVRTNGTRAETFWVAHPMEEKGQAVVAPYVVTSGGTATATHGAAHVQIPALLLDEVQGWVAFRIRSNYSTGQTPSGANSPTIFDWGDPSNARIAVLGTSNANAWRIQRSDGTTVAIVSRPTTITAGVSSLVFAYWTATTLGISVDGSAFVTTPHSAVPVLAATLMDLGSSDSNTGVYGQTYLDGEMLWAAGGIGAPVDANATSLNAIGDTDPTWAQLPALPTFLWTANDSNYIVTQSGRMNVDTYRDGASSVFGAATPVDSDMSIFASYTTAWVSRDRPEAEIARLPWAEAQSILGSTGGIASTATPGVCGWYGSTFDDDPGAFALVAQDGPFKDKVGQRLAISNGSRLAYVFCKAAAPLNEGEDLAVSQRVYAALDLLTTVPIEVSVEVLA